MGCSPGGRRVLDAQPHVELGICQNGAGASRGRRLRARVYRAPVLLRARDHWDRREISGLTMKLRTRSRWWPVAAIALLALPAFGQQALRSGEGIFTVSFQGGYGARFNGQYLLAGESVPRKLEGAVPTELKIIGTDFHLTVQNQTSGKIPE